MPEGTNQTAIFAYTVPAGKSLYIPKFTISMARQNGSAGSANVRVLVKDSDSNCWNTVRNAEITDSQEYNFANHVYFVASEKMDIIARVQSVSDNGTTVTGEADGFLIDNV